MGTARRGLAITSQKLCALLTAALATSCPTRASAAAIDVPAGTVKQAVFAIGKQAGVSIAILDPAVLAKPAPAIRQQSNADRALLQLANGSGLKLLRLGTASYALMSASPAPKVWRAKAKAPVPVTRNADPAPADQPGIIVVASKRDTLSSRFSGAWSRIDGAEFANLGVEGADAVYLVPLACPKGSDDSARPDRGRKVR